MTESSFDLIIVGAGAAGCVLASRLTEHSRKRVLLLEAGPDAPPGREHSDIRDSFPSCFGNPDLYWQDLTVERSAAGDTMPYLQGFGVGGGSNVNGMAADRGVPSDYDEWRDLGASGWGWDDVLPYFKKLERDLDFAGPLHGNNGPIPVRRLPPSQWAPFAKATADVLVRQGAVLIDDYMGDFRNGVSSTPMSCLEDRRVSASMAYLAKRVRARSNLTVLTAARAERLDVRDGVVSGVEASIAGERRMFRASEVIVTCGAIHTPSLLLRSGIGPEHHLRAIGVKPVHELRGVGRNLLNHPSVSLFTHLKHAGRQPAHQRPWQQNQLRYSSNVEGCAEHDMMLLLFNKGGWHSLGAQIAALAVVVQKAYSKGSVELVSGDPAAAPRVRFNLLQDRRDAERLVGGLKMCLETLGEREIVRIRSEVFVPNMAVAAQLGRRSTTNRIKAWMVAQVLDIGPLRRALLKKRTLDVSALRKDDTAIAHYIRTHLNMAYHACGTCKMGRSGDPDAVVDSAGRVFGVRGLRVADASIFPTVPSGHLHFPVLMAAEKLSDMVHAEWRR